MTNSVQQQPSLAGAPSATLAVLVPYEQQLASSLRWSMEEGDRFFQGRGGAKDALFRIAKRLNELNIPYALAGGMALNAHGYRRFTEDVDILVTQDGLSRIYEELQGRGY